MPDNLLKDPVIDSQKYTLVSFVSPEDSVKEKQLYVLNQFMYNYANKNLIESSQRVVNFVNQQVRKRFEETLAKYEKEEDSIKQIIYEELKQIASNDVQLNPEDVLAETLREYTLDRDEIKEAYAQFETDQLEKLSAEFDALNGNAISTRGFKVRGCFSNQDEAKKYAEMLRKDVEPAHHIYMLETGQWVPWHPNPDTIKSEYMLEELNELMGQYNNNMQERDQQFNERKETLMNKKDEAKEKEEHQQMLRNKLRDRLKQVKHA